MHVQEEATAASDDEEGTREEEEAELPSKKKRRTAVATLPVTLAPAATAATALPREKARLSTEEDERGLHQWLQENRNPNTARTYDSSMRQFIRWAEGTGNAGLQQAIDVDRPSEANVAAYMRYMILEQGKTMATLGTSLSAIANHVRFVTDDSYRNPTVGPLVKAMRAVLKDRAPKPGAFQKWPLGWEQLKLVCATAARAMDPEIISLPSVRWMAERDRTMILLGFFFLLRRSEVARMRRKDVSFARLTSAEGKRTRILQVYVNEKSKNDAERKGHTRIAAERAGEEICVFRAVADYLNGEGNVRAAGADDPLFPCLEGGAMSEDTPAGRLTHWMRAAGIPQTEKYGFHSLRAGAATDAHRNGATEEVIKAHGNWKSDAVKIYIRQGPEEQLATTAALGRSSARG